MPFKTEYTVLNSPLHGIILPCRGLVRTEFDVYPMIKTVTEQRNWLYSRVDNKNQTGTPDIFVSRDQEYWYIEVKRLKKRRLESIEDDLVWQFGQLAFMKRALRNRSRYMLAVAKEDKLVFLKGVYDETCDYPDFVREF